MQLPPQIERFLPLALMLGGLILIIIYWQQQTTPTNNNATPITSLTATPPSTLTPTLTPTPKGPEPTWTPQPIIPTATPVTTNTTTQPSSNSNEPISPVIITPRPPSDWIPQQKRFGMTGAHIYMEPAYNLGLEFGSWLNWWTQTDEIPIPDKIDFWHMIRVREDGTRPPLTTTIPALTAFPGSYWIIGNEPDVRWQDNTTPETYAHIYHEAYTFIKQHDPTAQVVIGGVSQSTPLRRQYLDIVIDTYEAHYGAPMPVDVWNVHAFVLREERDSWGVDIPPGMDDTNAIQYEIVDHDNRAIFQQNIIDFRAWMADRGYQDTPLVVTEYGILLPNDYGFPPEAVEDFMLDSFDFFSTATNETGYPPDDYHLVQWWFWYSLEDPGDYPTGNLYDPKTNTLTPLGQAYADYLHHER
ncbi:MAG TPA: hypothetical protein VLL52_04590 [Anaerolineae bacterium]|nr:hypothetical protein [Anaerolineae bacterium]